jgi:recombination protein RecT
MNEPAPNQVADPAPKTFRDMILLPSYQRQIAQALPKGLTAERMCRVVLTAINKTPKLLDCTKESLWAAVLNCASLGLFPDSLGRAYLVPYGDQCTLIIGYKGLIDLAYRSDQIGMIQLKAVYKGDQFEYEFGLKPCLKHVPSQQPGELTHVYSIVHIKGADMASFDVMRKDEVERVKKRSRAKDNGPWQTDYDAMAMKTVFRRHSKVLPMSAEMAQAMDVDDDRIDFDLKPVEATVVGGGRFSKDGADEKSAAKQNSDQLHQQADQQNRPITVADCDRLAKELPPDVVTAIYESYSAHSLPEVSPNDLPAVHAALNKARGK